MKEAPPGEAARLVIQAFDREMKKPMLITPTKTLSFRGIDYLPDPADKKKEFKKLEFTSAMVKETFYPPCIQKLLQGVKTDGRKRGIFILVNFFRSLKLPNDHIKQILTMWNTKNTEPLSESYLIGQLRWHTRQKEVFLPPNCANEAYYKDIGIKCPDSICATCKNPVNYTVKKMREEKRLQEFKTKKARKRAKKKTAKSS